MILDRIIQGNVIDVMKDIPSEIVQTVVTSPPYWGLRDYGVPGQLGLEPTPEAYVANVVQVFAEVRRVLKDDGTLWLNLGDSYAGGGRGGGAEGSKQQTNVGSLIKSPKWSEGKLKAKDLVGIPWRVALALQADGWYLRSDIIWSKPNPMPESVTDRPTKAHEYIFLLSKNEKYFYDGEAIKEKAIYREDERPFGDSGGNRNGDEGRTYKPQDRRPLYKDARSYDGKHTDKQRGHGRRHAGFNDRWDAMEKVDQCSALRNKRSVWTVATRSFPDAHFATFPEALIAPCIMAGAPTGGTVLDPFMGAGTTALVAARLGRRFLGVELNPDYVQMARRRIAPELAQAKML